MIIPRNTAIELRRHEEHELGIKVHTRVLSFQTHISLVCKTCSNGDDDQALLTLTEV